MNVTIIDSWKSGQDVVSEIWEIEGQTLNDAVNTYESHPVFRWIEVYRNIQYASIVELESEQKTDRYLIESNIYPNPFKSRARIQLRVTSPQKISVTLYDLLGRKKGVLYDGFVTTSKEIMVPGEDLSSGVYWYRIESAHGVWDKLFVIAR